jgi:NADH:ubiquinone oxidoreductase subunit H
MEKPSMWKQIGGRRQAQAGLQVAIADWIKTSFADAALPENVDQKALDLSAVVIEICEFTYRTMDMEAAVTITVEEES